MVANGLLRSSRVVLQSGPWACRPQHLSTNDSLASTDLVPISVRYRAMYRMASFGFSSFSHSSARL
jgi:hypothetical protein